MVEPINVWHLNQIEVHLAPNLLSLGLVLESQKTTLDAFLSLVLKCGKLECLRINLFDQIFERSLENGQKQFLPSSLQQLFIEDYSYSGLNAIRQTCSGLCFTDFLKITSNCTNLEHSDFEWSSDLNPNDLLQLYNLKKLSSLSIQILLTDEYGSIPFHEYTFGGRKFDDFFFELLANLNSINTLKVRNNL
uniref:FTH domain-containing protein n=1 Tax=Meloidogyne hapla TaxID=6305 RepID=A0A1I8B535_MELHA